MKIIIPMAGKGARLRPHTLTVPKPLVSVAGKPIVQRLVEDLAVAYGGKIEEVAYITGYFGEKIEQDLIAIANSIGAKGTIYYQDVPLGIAHAILCAQESLSGNCIVAFADTLFRANFEFDANQDGIIWVQKVKDPSSFGVVQLDENGVITQFAEKSPVFISDLAIVGIYYFKDGDNLKTELQYLIDNDIKYKGEFQLTSALENMRQKNVSFKTGTIDEWLDCGNKEAVVYSNQRVLENTKNDNLFAETAKVVNSVIIDSVADLKPVIQNLSFAVSLYSGQMCTAPQNFFIPATGVKQGDTIIPYEEVKKALVDAIGGIANHPQMGPGTINGKNCSL